MSTESMVTQADFQREERFIVVKRKHLTEEQEDGIREAIELRGIDTVECVVVESDWPEYETVWRMIEARVTGRAAYPGQAYVTGLRDLAAQREPDAIAGVLRDCADMIERHRTAAQPEREAVLEQLRAEFQRWLDKGPDEQPHYPSGTRPFSTGDLKAFVAALTTPTSPPLD